MRLEGQLDALDCAITNGHRIVAPFPLTLSGSRAVIQGRAGVSYQAVVDGHRVVDIKSQGRDQVRLEE